MSLNDFTSFAFQLLIRYKPGFAQRIAVPQSLAIIASGTLASTARLLLQDAEEVSGTLTIWLYRALTNRFATLAINNSTNRPLQWYWRTGSIYYHGWSTFLFSFDKHQFSYSDACFPPPICSLLFSNHETGVSSSLPPDYSIFPSFQLYSGILIFPPIHSVRMRCACVSIAPAIDFVRLLSAAPSAFTMTIVGVIEERKG